MFHFRRDFIDSFESTATSFAKDVETATQFLITYKALLKTLLPDKAEDPDLMYMGKEALIAAKDAAIIIKAFHDKTLQI